MKDIRQSQHTFMFRFTVFTATYNRAHTLHRVFESLEGQTFRDFEWLIVDDGSRDDTKQLVEKWQNASSFPIRYVQQEHQGKHTAFNRGVQEARGELFLPLDSDDACVPKALERFNSHWESIPKEKRDHFTAVTVLCQDQDGRLIGDRFPQDVTDSDSQEIFYRFKIKGDKWGFNRTDVLRQFPFPIMEGMGFVPEGVVWSRIGSHFKTRFVNETLSIVWINRNPDSDQLTRRGDPLRYAAGHALWHQSILNQNIRWFLYAPGQFMRSAAHYVRFSLHTGRSILEQANRLNNLCAKVLWATTFPLGLLVYWRDTK